MDKLAAATPYITIINSIGLVGLVYYEQTNRKKLQEQIDKLQVDIKAETERSNKIATDVSISITNLDRKFAGYTEEHKKVHVQVDKKFKKILARLEELEEQIQDKPKEDGDRIPKKKKKKEETDDDDEDGDSSDGILKAEKKRKMKKAKEMED